MPGQERERDQDMIKVQIDHSKAMPEELAAFYAIPGMKDALGAINSRGRELNIQFNIVGGESVVARLMDKIGDGIKPQVEYDEYRKLDLR